MCTDIWQSRYWVLDIRFNRITQRRNLYPAVSYNVPITRKINCENLKLKVIKKNIRTRSTHKTKKIEDLIEFLSVEILSLDLSHIKAHEIVSGNLKHLLNFV